MNKKIVKGLMAFSLLAATALHATNGDNLIGIGVKSRAMGGTSLAVQHGAESGLNNPSLITSVEGTEISFGGTLFFPDIEAGFVGADKYTSDMDFSAIPEVSIAHKLTDNWFIGLGMWGTAGLGVNYNNAPFAPYGGNLHMVTSIQLLQFGFPIAYKTGGLSVGLTPFMQYGNLDINYHLPTGVADPAYANIGTGIEHHYDFGYNLGASYDFEQDGIDGLVVGIAYKSSVEMEYSGIFKAVTAPFSFPGFPDLYSGDTLEQPSEYGVGVSYTTMGHTFAFDYKNIQWSDAQGYSDFGWEDQDVYAFGYEYSAEDWALRAGYNYAKSTVVESNDPRLNLFNLLGFPATAEKHYTIGGSYKLTDKVDIDFAYVYQPTTTKTFNISGLPFPSEEFSVDHKETSGSVQLSYRF